MSWNIVDDKIKKAIEEGSFDNLPGQGKPQDLDDLMLVPEEVRMAYTVLKNAGHIPPEMEVKKEILELEQRIENTHGEDEKNELKKKLAIKITEYEIIREKFHQKGK